MQLKDTLIKPVSELTVEELEENLKKLKRLKVFGEPKTKSKAVSKSNKDKQFADLVDQIGVEKLAELLKEIK